MIYITQGHEKSIGLEVLLKSFLLLGPREQEKFLLVCSKKSLTQTLQGLKMDFEIQEDLLHLSQSKLKCHFFAREKSTESTQSLILSLKKMEKGSGKDLLLTMPTSKDQLFFQGKNQSGHTEFFRSYFQQKAISMVFFSPGMNLLLITDHIPLGKVPAQIKEKLIRQKVEISLHGFETYFHPIDEVIFSGVNPHAGEGGRLGSEESQIQKALVALQKTYPEKIFLGPFSGDTLSFHRKAGLSQLFVYMFHDQGLSLFKAQNQFIGLNITFGLPFLRLSVDHGTAFDLYGKDQANFQGCLYLLTMALKLHSKL